MKRGTGTGQQAPNVELAPPAERAKPVRRAGGILRHVAPIEIAERAKAFVEAYGTVEACRLLGGISSESIARIVAGMTVRRGTIAIVRDALDKRDRAACRRGEDGVK